MSRALILVRNTVTHDARILREAATLRGLDNEVMIAGVVSTIERERELEIDGIHVARLDPASLLRSMRPHRRRPERAVANPPAQPRPAAAGAGSPGFRVTARRLALTAAYYLQGAALVRRVSPDLVHANDYNTMWIGIAAKLLCRSRLVYDTHELWPDRNGRPEWRPWLLACEALFVRVADAVLTTSPGYAEAIARRYRVPPPTVVRNIPERTTPAPPTARERSGEPVIAYVGGLMPGRGLEQAIRALAHAPELRLRLVGPGNDAYRAALRSDAEEAGVAERLELRPPVSPGELLQQLADADAGLMLIEPVCRSYELTLPNKLFEYAAAGLPILASDLPVLGEVVRSERLGEIVAVDEVEQVADGMRRVVSAERNAAARERVREFAARETWPREREVLERVYRTLGTSRRD